MKSFKQMNTNSQSWNSSNSILAKLNIISWAGEEKLWFSLFDETVKNGAEDQMATLNELSSKVWTKWELDKNELS